MIIKKSGLIIAFFIIIALIGGIFIYKGQPSDIPGFTQAPTLSIKPETSSPKPSTTQPSTTNPVTLSLKVPFTPQAPTGNWDELHNEACEEASAIMVAAYFSGDTRAKLPATEVEEEITALTNWQQTHFGYYLDTTTAETAEMIRSFYNLKTTIITDYTEKDIKDALNANKLVILPINGRLIGNPYYRQPGPIYHMLVVRGYTATQLITNDPGTRNGESYKYSFTTLKNAPADWDHSIDTISENKSLMIVVSK
ncbi:MAG: hypothetical protein A2735_03175 [Candidatus Yanofskybacteria bacterium RIFCSPHIGHO2_01_FULL_41_21]|uniref:Peptidase C39-like domain-containing protein n=1 Tax=Candidatus Yanofskybacteria bacterium RIFCSPHIGHO2_01_FULL_41_21 TaxID=1802660 RepID=A0A1F8EBI1_9BACT|nr:MAG: hypothetical protein A2735_03175 [Candidatus Yanofskybacteria bacterium RIFCSPHIGHO2_01_FULL_41_21]